jgi:hypothetical protein
MAGPWEKYQKQAATPAAGPWAKYQQPASAPQIGTTPESMGIKNPIPQAVPPALKPMASAQPPSATDQVSQGMQDASIGALKGFGNTVYSGGQALRKGMNAAHLYVNSPWETFDKPADIIPTNDAQKAGYGAEQVGEFLIPSGAAEKAGALTAGALKNAPSIVSKSLPFLAKVGTEAAETGTRNLFQGGDFKSGAIAGAAGAAASPVMQKAAAGVADIAMRPGKRLLKEIPEGAQNIGKTVLDNSTGVRPRTIAQQLSAKSQAANVAQDALLNNAKQAGTQVNLYGPRQVAGDALNTALRQNSPEFAGQVSRVSDQLHYQATPAGTFDKNALIPPMVDPVRARELRQGLDKTVTNWNPEAKSSIAPVQRQVRGALSSELHAAVPGSAELDQQMTNLIPATQAARNVAYDPSITKNLFSRFARPTGALLGGVYGADKGYRDGGVGGAIVGGGLGLALPEMIASPAGQMITARMMASPRTINAIKGGGLQLGRPSLDDKKPNR